MPKIVQRRVNPTSNRPKQTYNPGPGSKAPVVQRRHSGGGKPKTDKRGHLLPDSTTGK